MTDVSRRGFLAAAAGGAATAAAAGGATAQEGGPPDFGGYLDDVPNYDGVVDRTGSEQVTVTVGADANNNLSFGPAAIHVDPGTTVVWEWSGEGGSHNVVHEDGEFESDLTSDEGATYEHTFEADGIYLYFCQPHKAVGMKGAVVVGTDYPTRAGAATPTEADGAPAGGAAPEPDFGGWFGDVPYYDGVTDERGTSEVTVTVGGEPNNALSFIPAAIHVDPGTTVVWEWTGEGGAHNVVDQDGDFRSGDPVAEAGTTYEYTFEADGVYNYYCDPHRALGMKGSVVVGTDYPAVETPGGDGGAAGPQYIPDSAKTLGLATVSVTVATLGLAYVFIKYGGGPAGE